MQFGDFSVISFLKNKGNSIKNYGKYLIKSYFYLIIPEYKPHLLNSLNYKVSYERELNRYNNLIKKEF